MDDFWGLIYTVFGIGGVIAVLGGLLMIIGVYAMAPHPVPPVLTAPSTSVAPFRSPGAEWHLIKGDAGKLNPNEWFGCPLSIRSKTATQVAIYLDIIPILEPINDFKAYLITKEEFDLIKSGASSVPAVYSVDLESASQVIMKTKIMPVDTYYLIIRNECITTSKYDTTIGEAKYLVGLYY